MLQHQGPQFLGGAILRSVNFYVQFVKSTVLQQKNLLTNLLLLTSDRHSRPKHGTYKQNVCPSGGGARILGTAPGLALAY